MENVKHVNTQEFEELLKGELPVVCDFWATWCQPCRMLAPVLEEVAAELKDKAVFVKVDIDKEEELAVMHKIYSIPCVKVFKNGNEVAQNVGFVPPDALKQFVEENV